MDYTLRWDSICRICLQGGEMCSIFDNDDKNIQICDKIIKCSNISIKRENNLPEQICKSCLNDLDVAYRFCTNCENSEAILNSLIDNSTGTISSNTIVTDLIVSSENGNVYKYKPPAGLNVKRIKTSQSTSGNINEIKLEPEIETEGDGLDGLIIEHFDNNDETVEDHDDELKEEEEVLEEQSINKKDEPKKITRRRGRSAAKKNNEENKFEMIENGEVTTIKPVKSNRGHPSTKNKTTTPSKSKTQKIKVLPPQDVTMKPDGTAVIRIRKTEEEKPMKICEICGNTYKYKHALESHMRRHRNEKPFACEICGRAFVINFELRRHMRTHTGQKPYMCRYCGRRFSDFGSRIKHERTHTGERPYACETCGKAFSYSHVLQSHILTHTGEKRYECTLCGKRFTKSHHLKAHMNTHNKNQNKSIIVKKEKSSATQSPVLEEEIIIPTTKTTTTTTIVAPSTSNWTETSQIIQTESENEIEQKIFIDEKYYLHDNKLYLIKEKKEIEDISFNQLC